MESAPQDGPRPEGKSGKGVQRGPDVGGVRRDNHTTTSRTMRAAWWWIDRWRKSTAFTDMTAEEQGVYRNLLDELWLRDGVIPSEDRILSKISGDPEAWPRVRATVLKRFRLTPEGYRNDTHDEVASGSKDFRASQAEKGRKGAAARWGNGPANDRAISPANDLPSPSPSPLTVLRTPQEGRKEPPALPPADEAERSIRRTTDALRSRLYGLVGEAVHVDPKGRDATELMRLFTSYSKTDGTPVRGVINASLLTHERLERSIADAEQQIEEWKNGTRQDKPPAAGPQQVRRV